MNVPNIADEYPQCSGQFLKREMEGNECGLDGFCIWHTYTNK